MLALWDGCQSYRLAWFHRRNKIGDLGAEALAGALAGLVHLTKLDLRYLLHNAAEPFDLKFVKSRNGFQGLDAWHKSSCTE
jgi:hypothetical protein